METALAAGWARTGVHAAHRRGERSAGEMGFAGDQAGRVV